VFTARSKNVAALSGASDESALLREPSKLIPTEELPMAFEH